MKIKKLFVLTLAICTLGIFAGCEKQDSEISGTVATDGL